MSKISHDREVCIGCGACASLCPKHWQMSEDGKSSLKSAVFVPESTRHELEIKEVGCNQDAADACPVQCISVSKE